MSCDSENTLISHLEALRSALLKIFAVTALLYPAAYLLTPCAIRELIRWCVPESMGKLHYFSPMEVFFVQLKLALILALVLAYPWNIMQVWKFLAPALYPKERKTFVGWIAFSSVLFLGGAAFCIALILPMLMRFSGGFATVELQPVLGLANFLSLAGWLTLSFGVMFQAPAAVLIAVKLGVISTASLRQKRPYVMTVILIIAAILTPPDVVSQLMLAVPTWLLFELGLFIAKRIEEKTDNEPT